MLVIPILRKFVKRIKKLLYTDVIVPVPLHDLFTYSIPVEMEGKIHEGSRVIVQFGKKKFYTAIVFSIYQATEPIKNIKAVTSILEDYPIVNPAQLRFWSWIATYYMCTLGDVFRAAVPSALKIESETFVIRNPEYESDEAFTAYEQKVFNELIAGKPFKISELEKLASISNILPVIKSLADKGAISLSETLQDDYKAKTETAIRLAKNFSEQELNYLLDGLSRAPKQQEVMLTYLQAKPLFRKDLLLLANTTTSVINELIKKGILATYEVQVDRIEYGESDLKAAHALNTFQEKAIVQIYQSFETKDVTLLHGVTGSGKTEIYIQMIKNAMAEGKQVLYLVPEIALTTQITDRLKKVFGNKLAVYHSRFNENERAETWNKLLSNSECQVVLGARSAIFLPFSDLGLIIVDEEHDASYKQQDPNPRYNARNAAIVLANMHRAKTILGTATPALETYYNALNSRYGLVSLNQRHANMALPQIEIINTKELRRKKQMKHFLSPPLIRYTQEALDNKNQIILFQNRRGYAPMLECKTCSWTPLCQHCDVSLTYHKGANIMVCHYCGATYKTPDECPNCETPTLDIVGYGTERVEEEVNELFPQAKVARMDLDTTRGKKAYEKLITDFETEKLDILIGTQMVSKGLDFEKVNIVGILNADSLMNYPDFRAHERAFQMLTQVSGRAGRKEKQGTVLLQTSQPNHPIIQFVRQNDYLSFYESEIEERRMFRYPPFYRLIEISLKAKDERRLEAASILFTELLRKTFNDRVLGPSVPPISRIQQLYIRKILLKIENSASIKDIRENIYYCKNYVTNTAEYKSIMIYFDVDPM